MLLHVCTTEVILYHIQVSGTNGSRLAGLYARSDKKINDASVWVKQDNSFQISLEVDDTPGYVTHADNPNNLIWVLTNVASESEKMLYLWAEHAATVPRTRWSEFNEEIDMWDECESKWSSNQSRYHT